MPFPFLTPDNEIFPDMPTAVHVEGDGLGDPHTTFDFTSLLGGPLPSHVVWIRINANNLGNDSINIGIDNIRFGQELRASGPMADDPALLEALAANGFVAADVPERPPLRCGSAAADARHSLPGSATRSFAAPGVVDPACGCGATMGCSRTVIISRRPIGDPSPRRFANTAASSPRTAGS